MKKVGYLLLILVLMMEGWLSSADFGVNEVVCCLLLILLLMKWVGYIGVDKVGWLYTADTGVDEVGWLSTADVGVDKVGCL